MGSRVHCAATDARHLFLGIIGLAFDIDDKSRYGHGDMRGCRPRGLRKSISTEYASFLRRLITPVEQQEWATPDPRVWIAESAAIRETIYPAGDQLSWSYAYQHNPTIDRRLAQAGVRMAAYLNELFG